eukprot:jgi/Mesen1/8254/ME000445S07409
MPVIGMIHRNGGGAPTASPKGSFPRSRASLSRPFDYLFREHRFTFILVGMVIASTFFLLQPQSGPAMTEAGGDRPFNTDIHRQTLQDVPYMPVTMKGIFPTGGKIPLGVKRTPLRIVVTGGAGFVGSHLVDRLMERGDQVIVVDNFFTGRKENVMHHFANPRFELLRHDVVEPLMLEVDQIYHLACPASPVHYKHNPVKTIKTNVVGTLNMLGLAKRVGARFLLTSTSEVYGDPLEHPQKESYWGNVNPIDVITSGSGSGSSVRIARIFNTYGPRMCIDDGRVVSNFVAQALRKEGMTVYGDGKQTRSFQFVSDLVVREVIDADAKIVFRENTQDDPHMRKPDIAKATEQLGWTPKIALRDGLPLMVEDFRKRIFSDRKQGAGDRGQMKRTEPS